MAVIVHTHCPRCRQSLPPRGAALLPLTRSARTAFGVIAAELREGGSPTFAAIQASLDLNSRGGAQHLVNRLIERGWLVRTQSGALALSPLAAAREASLGGAR